jgi:hypothetical protein
MSSLARSDELFVKDEMNPLPEMRPKMENDRRIFMASPTLSEWPTIHSKQVGTDTLQKEKIRDRLERLYLSVTQVEVYPAAHWSPDSCAPQTHPQAEYIETRGSCPAEDGCKIVPGYTSFDPRARK